MYNMLRWSTLIYYKLTIFDVFSYSQVCSYVIVMIRKNKLKIPWTVIRYEKLFCNYINSTLINTYLQKWKTRDATIQTKPVTHFNQILDAATFSNLMFKQVNLCCCSEVFTWTHLITLWIYYLSFHVITNYILLYVDWNTHLDCQRVYSNLINVIVWHFFHLYNRIPNN